MPPLRIATLLNVTDLAADLAGNIWEDAKEKRDIAREEDFVFHPVCSAGSDLHKSIEFVRFSALPSLPYPWPRNQDLPRDIIATPSADDLVLAVSHTWFYQRHPDPLGVESVLICQLARQALAEHQSSGDAMIFCDYLSVTQRPFKYGQCERTDSQQKLFKAALAAMPRLYLLADAVLHVEPPSPVETVSPDGEVISVDCSVLAGAELAEFASEVQVVGWRQNVERQENFGLFDRVIGIDGVPMHSMADVKEALYFAQKKLDASYGKERTMALIERAPFGTRNLCPAGERGWIYLERFCSMIKVAMVDESEIHRVIFSNSEAILRQIRAGGMKLREAAMAGEEKLKEVLDCFLQELQEKKFSGVSVDALKCSHIHGCDASQMGPSNHDGGRATVARIMKELVADLPKHWTAQVNQQRQRQLVLAVNRGDVGAVLCCLGLGVDPNFQDEMGTSCLHSAARRGDLPIVQALIDHGADLTLQDSRGQTPAHVIPLFANQETVQLFDMLTTPQVLSLTSNVGVCVFERFSVYSWTACEGKPFEALQRSLQAIQKQRLSLRGQFVAKTFSFRAVVDSHQLGISDNSGCQYSSFVSKEGTTVHVWEPTGGESELSILYLSMPFLLPWSMQMPTCEALAAAVCGEFKAKLFVLTHGFPYPPKEGALLSDFHADLLKIIDELPLKAPFVLLDSTNGLCSALLWPLRDRLAGAMLVNPAAFFSEEDRNSTTHKKISAMISRWSKKLWLREISFVRDVLIDWVVGEPSFVDTLVEKAQEALGVSNQDCWDFSAALYHWTCGEITESLVDKNSLDLRVTLACSQHGPQMLCHDSVQRLHKLLPQSKIFYIPSSKGLWQVENPGDVISELVLLLRTM
eukprot:CAMPEP_0170622178 /NCGR_PEP_ID=MMETSP0224-20130122/28989_1 /TAXON_ID=285029 /ORGANISM="Togula jolla, Strain CCCM 725" /LENGTH=864 /DNA_ID=CAMNT_0010948473 /DNA_START=55 /DNA_END=2650 /DNA_ORIENTATION=+